MVSITLVPKLGSLSNDNGDGNENDKKGIGLDWQNNNFARASRFLYISLPSLHDYDVELPEHLDEEPLLYQRQFNTGYLKIHFWHQ